MIEKKEYGLFVFRGQPLIHLGHIAAVNEMLQNRAERILFVVGSTNVYDLDNPVKDVETRIEGIRIVGQHEGWGERVVAIGQMPDTHDTTWGEGIGKILEWNNIDVSEVIARGNNPWTARVLNSIGIATYVAEEVHRENWQGNVIRKRMRAHDNSWKEAYPEYMWEYAAALTEEVIRATRDASYCER